MVYTFYLPTFFNRVCKDIANTVDVIELKLSLQCTYPVQFLVPATPNKQNNSKADKATNTKTEEKEKQVRKYFSFARNS